MEKIFEIIAKSLSEFFQTKYIAFFQSRQRRDFQLSPSQGELILKYATGFHPESLENLRRIRRSISMGILQRLMKEKNFQIENEIFEHEKELASWVKMDGLESVIGVPLLGKGDIWGVLLVFSQERYRFKKQDGEILNLWAIEFGELHNLFSSHLQTGLDGNLAQILGNIQLLKFRLRNKKSIQVSEILEDLKHLEDVILEKRQSLDLFHEKWAFEEKSEEKPKEEILSEEVITLEGERISSMEKRKVLIVDDQPIMTDLLVDILKRLGYNSEVALGGKDGLKIFAQDGFDLVITDLSMPDISGWEVSRSVKKQKPSVPVILITAWGVEPDLRKIQDSGVDFVLNKPFQIDQLEKIIKSLVSRNQKT